MIESNIKYSNDVKDKEVMFQLRYSLQHGKN